MQQFKASLDRTAEGQEEIEVTVSVTGPYIVDIHDENGEEVDVSDKEMAYLWDVMQDKKTKGEFDSCFKETAAWMHRCLNVAGE